MPNNYNPNYQERRYLPRTPHRRMVVEIVKTHDERKIELEKCIKRKEEIYADVASARLDGMPKTNRPYTDRIGERVDKLEQLEKYIERNREMVKAVDDSLDLIGRGCRIMRKHIEEYGSKAQVYFWAKKSIELSIKINEPGCDYGRWPFGERLWITERRAFLDRIAQSLCYVDLER